MTIIVCLVAFTLLSYFLSDYIKKYNRYVYLGCAAVSIVSIFHAILILNGYSIEYAPVLKQIMNSIDSGAVGGSLFILVMYMGVMDMKYKISKKLRRNRAELSIIACIFTIPHNIHYFFAFLLNSKTIVSGSGLSLWTNLMMFASGVFAISIMLPLFVTSFMHFRRKMKAMNWKSLQEFAYIFYAMVYMQVMMLYISRPDGWEKILNLVVYSLIFLSYTILKVKSKLERRMISKKEMGKVVNM